MAEVTLTSDITVEEIQHVGDDAAVVAAARVSTKGWDSVPASESSGLIRYLMEHRHGTPFEHGSLTVRVHAPIFVWREWHRHRVQSFNEQSARYSRLEPVFWIPRREREMVPAVGFKPARPSFVAMTSMAEYEIVIRSLKEAYQKSYDTYEHLLSRGVAKEIARSCLPVSIYSACWVTVNPRSLMHFLSLRTRSEIAKFPSYPQAEIEEAAWKMDALLAKYWPQTHRAFNECGRVAP